MHAKPSPAPPGTVPLVVECHRADGTLFRYEGDVPRGTWLRDVALRAGWPLPFPCAGKGECGECRVKVLTPGAGAHSQAELFHLPAALRRGRWRLACFMRIDEPTHLVAPPPDPECILLLDEVRREVPPEL